MKSIFIEYIQLKKGIFMNQVKYQVFLSSTFKDLNEERKKF